MTTSVSIDAQTEAIPRIPVAVLAVHSPQVAAAEPDAAVADAGTNAEISAAASDAEVAASEINAQVATVESDADVAASVPNADVTREKSVQHMYEAGLAKLDALHDRWTAAMAELRKAQVDDGPGELAA